MPRIQDIFRRKLKNYIQDMQKRKLAKNTWVEEQRVNLHALRVLQENHMETNPGKLGEKEVYIIMESMQNKKWAVLTLFRFLQYCGNPTVKRGAGGNYTINKTPVRWPLHQKINVDWLNEIEREPDIVREMADTPLEQLLIHLELDLGLRRIECLRLREQDIKVGYLNILGKGRLGGKWRTIPMHPRTPQILQQYREHREQLFQRAWKKNKDIVIPEQLIIYERGGSLRSYKSETAIDNKLKDIQTRLRNIGHSVHFSNHTLRRTFGRTMWKARVPIETIAKIMGHESTETTIQYLGIQMMDMQQAMTTVYQYTEKGKKSVEMEVKVH